MKRHVRGTTSSGWLRRVVVAFVALLGLNVLVRTAQYLWPILSRTNGEPGNQCSNDVMILASALTAQYGVSVDLRSVFDQSVDADGDGVDALSEFLQATSDRNPDCDEDGIADLDDRCPDCRTTDYRAVVEGKLIEGLLTKGDRDDAHTVYVRMPWSRSVNVTDAPYRVVPSPEWHFGFVQSYFGRVPRNDISWLYLDPVVVVPGVAYLYQAKMVCGSRCGWTDLAILIDIPLMGPFFVAAKNLWVS